MESRQSDVEVSIAVERFTSDKYGIVCHRRPPRRVGGGRVVFITIADTELEVIEPHRPMECLARSEGDSTHPECAVFFRIIPRNFSIGPVMVSPIPSSQEAPELAGER